MSDGWERGVVESRRRPASESSRARWSSSAAQNPMSSSGRRREAFQGQNGGVLAERVVNQCTQVGRAFDRESANSGGLRLRRLSLGFQSAPDLPSDKRTAELWPATLLGVERSKTDRQFVFNTNPIPPAALPSQPHKPVNIDLRWCVMRVPGSIALSELTPHSTQGALRMSPQPIKTKTLALTPRRSTNERQRSTIRKHATRKRNEGLKSTSIFPIVTIQRRPRS